MLILAFDTTSEWGGAGIFRDKECLGSAAHNGPANYSVSLFQEVERLLKESGRNLEQIDLFAAAKGPGSFTGIRVGLAAAQGWANAFGKPLRSVSVFEAMVEQAQPETDHAVPLLDARRGEFYAGIFRSNLRSVSSDGGKPQEALGARFHFAGEGLVAKPEHLASLLQAQIPEGSSVTCVVRETDEAARELERQFPPAFRWKYVKSLLVPDIARLALRAHQEGYPISPDELSPAYIRRPDAELNWKG
ncbi:MAG TPA: tRNA (adenosine(37)-N6)-threonylcarbamoyltransferase complex dimerization subunit type 1 TsaB [Terriglobia bacterium]|nr:tRNA (adenosine(37)-N6)-threonylcarbamoyltransferase complex dimerization subunit type 1 TsaB [Terriglobia bacterium]